MDKELFLINMYDKGMYKTFQKYNTKKRNHASNRVWEKHRSG